MDNLSILSSQKNLLLIDIGHSTWKFSKVEDGIIQPMQRGSKITGLIDEISSSRSEPIILTAVNKLLGKQFIAHLTNDKRSVHILDENSPYQFKLDYDMRDKIGIDRLCGLEGALAILLFRKMNPSHAIMTIDSGTLTSINIINEKNEFIGGMILPGIHTQLRAIRMNNPQIPLISFDNEIRFIGNNTISCIQSGIIGSTVALIEKVYQELSNPHVFITGGGCPLFRQYLTIPNQWIPNLNLLGMISVAEKLLFSQQTK
jgi:pantothenate kinase type III